MTDDEKILTLLRKLDPVKEEATEKKPNENTQGSVTGFGNPERTPTPDSNKAAEQATGNTTAEQLMNQGGTGSATSQAGNLAQNRYTENAEKVNPNINTDWIKNNPWGNVNDMSYSDTLNLARLADAFNAQRGWFAPNVSPLSRGGEGGGIHTNMIQNPQLNTQEQKQADLNRQYASQRMSYDLARQDRSKNIPVTMEEAIAKGILDKGQQQDLINLGFGDQVRRDIWNNIYNKEYSQNLTERIQQFAADVAQQENWENANFLLNVFSRNPTLAVITAQQFNNTQMPSFETWLEDTSIMDQLNKQGLTPNDPRTLQWYQSCMMALAANKTYMTAAGTMGMLGQGIAGFGSSIFNPGGNR